MLNFCDFIPFFVFTTNHHLNPLYTNGLFHCYMLDESICHFRVVWSIFFFFFFFAFILFLMENPLTNNEDPDQKPHDIASDLGLHFLPMTLCGFPTKL